MKQEDDLEKLNFYLSAQFEMRESMLFSNLVLIPSRDEINKLLLNLNKKEIEQLYNHFHISSISDDLIMQREYCMLIWRKWRMFFDEIMPKENVIIEVVDHKMEVIISVYNCV